jgi:hypothetical protein
MNEDRGSFAEEKPVKKHHDGIFLIKPSGDSKKDVHKSFSLEELFNQANNF